MGNAVCCFSPEVSPRRRSGIESQATERRGGSVTAKTAKATRVPESGGARFVERQHPAEAPRLSKMVEKLESGDECRESGKGSAKSIEEGGVSGKRAGGVASEGSPVTDSSSTQTQDLEEEVRCVDSAKGEAFSGPKPRMGARSRVVGDSAMLMECVSVEIREGPVSEVGEGRSLAGNFESEGEDEEEENVEGPEAAMVGVLTPTPRARAAQVVAGTLPDRLVRDVTNELTRCSRDGSSENGCSFKQTVPFDQCLTALVPVEVEGLGSRGVAFTASDGESVTLDAVEDRGELEERFYQSSDTSTVDVLSTECSAAEVSSAPPQYLMYSLDPRLASLPLDSLRASQNGCEGEGETRFGTPKGRVALVNGSVLRYSTGSVECHPLSVSACCSLLDSQSSLDTDTR